MKKQIEILAPAGSYEGMKAAMNAGCDAVYIGGGNFGARAFASNLEEDLLLQAIDEAHIRDKKLYLTVNTLIKEKEMTQKLYHFLEKFYLQGLDAVIVQDVGAMNFIHKHFPDLKIHASTQTTITMAEGTELIKELGVNRIVTPRELSLKEIKQISENTDLEIETFVHGALCYCYSGQCLMSSMIGGRSGNRGRCAQPCRMPYEFYEEGKKLSSSGDKYLLSPKDINSLAILPELIEAGVTSLKIEGRMKRPEYAAGVTSMYRKYVDLYLSAGKDQYYTYLKEKEYKKDMENLMDIYNRGGFSEGYAKTYHGKSMMSMNRPNHSGVLIGEISKVIGSQVTIRLKEDINAQDILEIRSKTEDNYEFTVKSSAVKGETLTVNIGRKSISPKNKIKDKSRKPQKETENYINIGDLVYRTRNNHLLEQISEDYLGKERKLLLTGELVARKGELLKLSVSYQNNSVTVYHDEVQAAKSKPMSEEKLSAQLKKTGDTIYTFDKLTIIAEDDIFIPVSSLNEIRRDALIKLQEYIANMYRRNPSSMKQYMEKDYDKELRDSGNNIINDDNIKKQILSDDIQNKINQPESLGICVSLQTMKQFHEAIKHESITSIYAELDSFTPEEINELSNRSLQADKQFYLILPHICRASVYDRLKKEIVTLIENDNIKGFVSKNYEETWLLQSLLIKEKSQKEIILDYNMYILNNSAKNFWNEQGITHFTAPVELNYQELKTLGVTDCDFIVYGYLPVMISAQCVYDNLSGCRKGKGANRSHWGHLIDRLGKKFYVQTNCSSCYNRIYNGQCLSLHKQASDVMGMHPKNIRMDFTMESDEEMRRVLQAFHKSYIDQTKSDFEPVNYTAGHFNRGVE